jgi:DNA-binding CsgD family transcriptional regulator
VHSAVVDDVLDLLCRVYGLTAHERELVALIVEGPDTRDIAELLFSSRDTAQDHLKSLFEIVGARSLRELVSGVFLPSRINTRQSVTAIAHKSHDDRAAGCSSSGRFRANAECVPRWDSASRCAEQRCYARQRYLPTARAAG